MLPPRELGRCSRSVAMRREKRRAWTTQPSASKLTCSQLTAQATLAAHLNLCHGGWAKHTHAVAGAVVRARHAPADSRGIAPPTVPTARAAAAPVPRARRPTHAHCRYLQNAGKSQSSPCASAARASGWCLAHAAHSPHDGHHSWRAAQRERGRRKQQPLRHGPARRAPSPWQCGNAEPGRAASRRLVGRSAPAPDTPRAEPSERFLTVRAGAQQRGNPGQARSRLQAPPSHDDAHLPAGRAQSPRARGTAPAPPYSRRPPEPAGPRPTPASPRGCASRTSRCRRRRCQ